MKYILRKIDSEEEFMKTFGQNPKWIFSPLRITTGLEAEKKARLSLNILATDLKVKCLMIKQTLKLNKVGWEK